MTLAEAIRTLNERRHRGCADWQEMFRDVPPVAQWVQGDDRYDTLSAFEAVAVAEKYQALSAPTPGAFVWEDQSGHAHHLVSPPPPRMLRVHPYPRTPAVTLDSVS